MLRKTYRLLYVPEDHSTPREVKVPRWALLLSGGLLATAVLLAAFYVLGLLQGSSWLPGGSRLQRENERLAGEIDRLGEKIVVLRDHLQDSYHFQEMVSDALGIDQLDPEHLADGSGNRGPLPFASAAEDGAHRSFGMSGNLNSLLRQARLQNEGYQALLDTLSSRGRMRAHLPTIRPVDTGWISSGFGHRKDPFTGRTRFHRGLDFSVPLGTPVHATADGVVIALKVERGLGRMIRIDHGNGLTTTYAHLSAWHVKTGQRVTRGEIIGLSGNTGRSTAPHLHYEVAVSGRHVNPLPYLLDAYASR